MSSFPGRFHRGAHLPHCDQDELTHLITYRLADSLPQSVLIRMQEELEHVDDEFLSRERKRQIEYWLDKHQGECLLAKQFCAQYVVETWEQDHGRCYDLRAWVVMPNHVHVLVKIYKNTDISRIVQLWKSTSAHRINSLLCRTGKLWMRDYYDRYIRSSEHLFKAFDYILKNYQNGGILYEKKDISQT